MASTRLLSATLGVQPYWAITPAGHPRRIQPEQVSVCDLVLVLAPRTCLSASEHMLTGAFQSAIMPIVQP
jgi:hypothetical protein